MVKHQRNNGGSPVCGAEGGRLVVDRAKVDCPDCLAVPAPVMGRPLRAESAARNRTVRATDDEWRAWTEAAGERPVSDWLRELANRAVKATKERS